MDKFKYDTHIHTSEGSACANFSGKQQARLYKEMGYDGIFITDHFYNGNTAVSRKLNWEQWVDGFVKGYEEAKKEGTKSGLSVFFGWEETINGMDFLIYGLDREWLLENRDILGLSLEDHYRKVHEAGGFIVHAHPFRNCYHLSDKRPVSEWEDAVEIMNGGNKDPMFNNLAAEYARKWNKPVTGGSDSHHRNDRHGGIITRKPINSVKDFIDMVIERNNLEVLSF